MEAQANCKHLLLSSNFDRNRRRKNKQKNESVQAKPQQSETQRTSPMIFNMYASRRTTMVGRLQ